RLVKLFLVFLAASCSPAGPPTERTGGVSAAHAPSLDAAAPPPTQTAPLGPVTTGSPVGAPVTTGSPVGAPVTTGSPVGAPPAPVACMPGPGVDYPVGPGQKYTSIGAVPMEKLGPGDTLRIFYRAAPYAEKIMIGALGGTAALPVRVC